MQKYQDNINEQYSEPLTLSSSEVKKELFVELQSYRGLSPDQKLEADKLYKQTNNINAIDDFCKSILLKDQAQKLLSQSKINKRYSNAIFENFNVVNEATKCAKEKSVSFVRNINDHRAKGTNLIIQGCGCIGTGKTHLAHAIANELITKKGIPCMIIRVDALVRELKENFSIKEYVDIEILIIDDLGKEIGTNWVTEQIDAIVNARYEAMKPTVITTENSINKLKANYGDKGKAIISRLTQDFILISLSGEDYRQIR